MTHEIYKRIDKGEYDLTNEALGITALKPVMLKSNPKEGSYMASCTSC